MRGDGNNSPRDVYSADGRRHLDQRSDARGKRRGELMPLTATARAIACSTALPPGDEHQGPPLCVRSFLPLRAEEGHKGHRRPNPPRTVRHSGAIARHTSFVTAFPVGRFGGKTFDPPGPPKKLDGSDICNEPFLMVGCCTSNNVAEIARKWATPYPGTTPSGIHRHF